MPSASRRRLRFARRPLRGLASAVAVAAALATLLVFASPPRRLLSAQPPARADYLDPELRRDVDALKAAVREAPTIQATLFVRAEVLRRWVDAFSLTGQPMSASATTLYGNIRELRDTGRIDDGSRLPSLYGSFERDVDAYVRELTLKDEEPGALGPVTLARRGPFVVRTHQTLEQTYTVGSRALAAGAMILVGRQLMADYGQFQTDDPRAENHVTIRASDPGVRFAATTVQAAGVHAGFRAAVPALAFRLEAGALDPGETATVVYGDRSGGSRGFQLQSFQSEAVLLPLYLDLDGSGLWLTPSWESFAMVGGEAAAVRVFAPSVLQVGEAHELAIRTEDDLVNRATSGIPAYRVSVDGREVATVPAGRNGVAVAGGLRLDRPGTYRYEVRSQDGRLRALSNPIWVEESPELRVFWGETHAHTGMAEGQGTIDALYRYAQEDARLDFLGFSEHDLWLDAAEWNAVREAVDRYGEDGRFVAYLAWEWTVNRGAGGHHNVLLRRSDLAPAAAQDAYDLSLLYETLRRRNVARDVLVIPHAHIAGYWRTSDSDLERLVEIQSMHGTFEWFGDYYLRRGAELGFVAASDDHRSRPGLSGTSVRGALQQVGGLAAVLASDPTRDSLFDAMRARRTYAATGARRILLDVRLNEGRMGERVAFAAERRMRVRASGTAPLAEVSVLKNGAVLVSRRHASADLEPETWVAVRFASSSEAFVRDNPRGYRPWRGALTVTGARLEELRTSLDNYYSEFARIDPADPSRVLFLAETRGDEDLLLLRLSGASRGTELRIAVEASREQFAGPPLVRDFQPLPAAELAFPFAELADGRVRRELQVDRHTDRIEIELVDPEGPLDVDFELEDLEDAQPGDYYFVRLVQLDGAQAWSSPIWVGGESRR